MSLLILLLFLSFSLFCCCSCPQLFFCHCHLVSVFVLVVVHLITKTTTITTTSSSFIVVVIVVIVAFVVGTRDGWHFLSLYLPHAYVDLLSFFFDTRTVIPISPHTGLPVPLEKLEKGPFFKNFAGKTGKHIFTTRPVGKTGFSYFLISYFQ